MNLLILSEPINYFFIICNRSVLGRLEYLSIPYIFIAEVHEAFGTTIGTFLLCRFLYYSIEKNFKFLCLDGKIWSHEFEIK